MRLQYIAAALAVTVPLTEAVAVRVPNRYEIKQRNDIPSGQSQILNERLTASSLARRKGGGGKGGGSSGGDDGGDGGEFRCTYPKLTMVNSVQVVRRQALQALLVAARRRLLQVNRLPIVLESPAPAYTQVALRPLTLRALEALAG